MRLLVDAREMTFLLLDSRVRGGSVCPSEVAKALSHSGAGLGLVDWRDCMPEVHAAVDQRVAKGAVELSWKG